MGETSAGDTTLTLLKLLRLLCFGVPLVPAAVLAVCAVLSALNENAGWLRYPLPLVLLGVYLLAGLASPVVGISALIILFTIRGVFREGAADGGGRLRSQVVILSLLDISATVFWVMLLPYVIFSAGGSR